MCATLSRLGYSLVLKDIAPVRFLSSFKRRSGFPCRHYGPPSHPTKAIELFPTLQISNPNPLPPFRPPMSRALELPQTRILQKPNIHFIPSIRPHPSISLSSHQKPIQASDPHASYLIPANSKSNLYPRLDRGYLRGEDIGLCFQC